MIMAVSGKWKKKIRAQKEKNKDFIFNCNVIYLKIKIK